MMSLLFSWNVNAQKWHSIPTKVINVYELIGDTSKTQNDSIEAFEMSDFVRFKDYKLYLKSIKKDSSKAFYVSQLPDSSILRDEREYRKYLKDKRYDDHPVVGVSWENAMNYCKWKTIEDNSSKEFDFIYRLPKWLEWFAASKYLERQGIANDLDYKYSDWVMENYFVNMFWNAPNLTILFPNEADMQPPYPWVMQKIVVGNSFLFQRKSKTFFLRTFYSNQGYRHIAFRLVKKHVDASNEKSLENRVIEFWNSK